jgi:hypothetical protein
MEARGVGLRAAAPTSSGWAAPKPPLRGSAAEAAGGGAPEWKARGEAAAAATRPGPRHSRCPKTPSAVVPGTASDLLFSFTKKGKRKKKEENFKREEKNVGKKKIAPNNCCRDRNRPPRHAVGGKGTGAGKGVGKEEDWAS